MVNQLTLYTRINREEGDEDTFLVTAIQIDGQPLLDFDRFGLSVDLYQLTRSRDQDGEFLIVTCWCGYAECGASGKASE